MLTLMMDGNNEALCRLHESFNKVKDKCLELQQELQASKENEAKVKLDLTKVEKKLVVSR